MPEQDGIETRVILLNGEQFEVYWPPEFHEGKIIFRGVPQIEIIDIVLPVYGETEGEGNE